MDKKKLYANKNLKTGEKQLLLWLNDFGEQDKNKEIHLTYNQIAEALAITVGGAYKSISGLIAKGYISKQNYLMGKNKKSGNSYILLK